MAMKDEVISAVDKFCSTDKSANKDELLESILTKIEKRELSLQELVALLQEYLTNSNEHIRGQGTKIFCRSLSRVPGDTVDLQTVRTLCNFFADRMYDFHCISELLLGIKSVFTRFAALLKPEQDVFNIINQLFSEVHVQALSVSTRKTVFEILSIVAQKYPKLCGVDFLSGFISCIDGERDPRNLLIVFDLYQQLCNATNGISPPKAVSDLSEELFDVISCYFPIMFTPSANDPEAITPEQLAKALGKSIACNPAFASISIPFLLDKLATTHSLTKIQTFATLAECCRTYGAVAITRYLPEIWTSLRTEILRSTVNDVISGATMCITVVVETIAGSALSTADKQKSLEGLTLPALIELRSPESKFSTPYGAMLSAAASASVQSCELIADKVVPELIELFNESTELGRRNDIVVVLVQLLEAIAKHFTDKQQQQSGSQSKALQIAEKYVPLIWKCINALSNASNASANTLTTAFSRLALFESIATRTPELGQNSVDELYEQLRSALLANQQQKHSRAAVDVKWLIDITSVDTEATTRVQRNLFGPWLASLTTSNTSTGRESIESTLRVIQQLSTPHVASYFVQSLITAVQSTLVSEKSSSEVSIPLLNALNSILDSVIKRTRNVAAATAAADSSTLLSKEETTAQLLSLLDTSRTLEAAPIAVVEALAKTVVRLVSSLDAADQSSFVTDAFNVVRQQLRDSNCSETAIAVFGAVLLGCHKEHIDTRFIDDLLPALIERFFVSDSDQSKPLVMQYATYITASIINKSAPNSLDAIMQRYSQQIVDEASKSDVEANQLRAINLLSWILKALAMRGSHAHTETFGAALCTIVNTATKAPIAEAAAEGFGVVMSEHSDVLHADTNARVAFLYKQRFFTLQIETLISELKAADSNNNAAVLIAVTHMIANVPKAVILAEVPRLLPFVLRALESSNTALAVTALTTIHMLLRDASSEMESRLDSIVPALLPLVSRKDSVQLRLTAIGCLNTISEYPFTTIYPHKDKIIASLVPALDDIKRVVRREAVRCRNDWFLLSE